MKYITVKNVRSIGKLMTDCFSSGWLLSNSHKWQWTHYSIRSFLQKEKMLIPISIHAIFPVDGAVPSCLLLSLDEKLLFVYLWGTIMITLPHGSAGYKINSEKKTVWRSRMCVYHPSSIFCTIAFRFNIFKRKIW